MLISQTWCWEMACERQVYRLRNVFFSQIIRQDITWFDTNQSGDLTTKLFEYVVQHYLFQKIIVDDIFDLLLRLIPFYHYSQRSGTNPRRYKQQVQLTHAVHIYICFRATDWFLHQPRIDRSVAFRWTDNYWHYGLSQPGEILFSRIRMMSSCT